MADTGWQFPGTGANGNRGDLDWSTPGNITANDFNNAVASLDTSYSEPLEATNFSFNLPAGATIDGFEGRIGDYLTLTSSSGMDWTETKIIDETGTYVGTSQHADFATPNTIGFTDECGGPEDLWGTTGISDTDVEDIDFGFMVVAFEDGTQSDTLQLDYMQMKVYYSTGPEITDVANSGETPGSGTETWDDGSTGNVITGSNFV